MPPEGQIWQCFMDNEPNVQTVFFEKVNFYFQFLQRFFGDGYEEEAPKVQKMVRLYQERAERRFQIIERKLAEHEENMKKKSSSNDHAIKQ